MLNNSGAIAISALASANGINYAEANADVDGIYQEAQAPNGDASNSLTNDGTIDVHASATANAASPDLRVGIRVNHGQRQRLCQLRHLAVGDGPDQCQQRPRQRRRRRDRHRGGRFGHRAWIRHCRIGGPLELALRYPDANAFARVNVGINQYATADNFVGDDDHGHRGRATTVTTNYTYTGEANAATR